MAILFNCSQISVLDHAEFIKQIYKEVERNGIAYSMKLNPVLFSIKPVVKSGNKRKRKHENSNTTPEQLFVEEVYTKNLSEVSIKVKEILKKYSVSETSQVRDTSKALFKSTLFNFNLIGMKGGNNSQKSLECDIEGEKFLIPPNCRFLCGCVKDLCLKLERNKYNLLLADPPWWNKYIRRLKAANDKLSYSMMYNEEIAAIPVKNLLTPNALVAVWCTNAPSHIDAIKNLIFPAWGVKYAATWYWLKVTTNLEPLCDFGVGSQKQPYERILLGYVGDPKNIQENKVIWSVPSALHSHKPPLIDLLSPLIEDQEPEVLELFARYLLPNTTSVGYEPLKWQHISLYDTII